MQADNMHGNVGAPHELNLSTVVVHIFFSRETARTFLRAIVLLSPAPCLTKTWSKVDREYDLGGFIFSKVRRATIF
jgi:hypothetical protein